MSPGDPPSSDTFSNAGCGSTSREEADVMALFSKLESPVTQFFVREILEGFGHGPTLSDPRMYPIGC